MALRAKSAKQEHCQAPERKPHQYHTSQTGNMRHSVLISTGSLFYLTNIDFHVLQLYPSNVAPLTQSPTCAVAQRWHVANKSCLAKKKKKNYFPYCCNIRVTERAPKIHVCSTHTHTQKQIPLHYLQKGCTDFQNNLEATLKF